MTGGALIGRDEELAFAASALAGYAHRPVSPGAQTGGLVLAGPAGVGKTALLMAIAERAREREFGTISITGSGSGRRIPFGAFAPVIPSRRSDPGPAPTESFDLLQSARHAVLGRAAGHGLVLIVDDAHLLDGPSAALVRQLTEAGQVFVAAALRPDGPVPADIRSLWKDGAAQRLELAPLSRAESTELSAALLNGQVGGALAEGLWRIAQGNPLYLREMIAAGVSGGAISAEGGVWMRAAGFDLGARLPALLSDRLAGASGEVRGVAEVLAIAGPLPLSLAEQVAGERALVAAEAAGLVVAQRTDAADPALAGAEPSVSLVHPLYAELLREQTPLLRARAIGRDIAARLRAGGLSKPADLLRCLVWELDGGVVPDAAELLAGAQKAVHAQDPVLAERLATAALRQDAGIPARMVLADALYRQGRPTEALQALGEHTGDDDETRTQIAVLRVYLLNWGLGDAGAARAVIDSATAAIFDSSCRAWLGGLRASMDFFAGRPGDAVARAEPLLDVPGLSTRGRLGVCSGLVPALAFCGRYADAEQLAKQGMEPSAVDEDEVPVSVSWAVGALILCYVQTGRVADLERLAQGVYAAELQDGHDEGRSLAAAALGHVALSRGHIAEAVRWLREAQHTMGHDWGGLGLFTIGTLALAQVYSGDRDGARRTIDEVREHVMSASAAFVPAVDVAEAWLTAADGRPDRAREMLREVAGQAAEYGRAGFRVEALDAIARLGGADTVVDQLSALADGLDSPLASRSAEYAQALAARDAPRLDAVADRLAAQQLTARAGAAAAAAAAWHERVGDRAAASAARERATAWLAGFDGVLPPDVTAWSAVQLSPRERQICLLAANGHTSKRIAEELVISVRTVDGHLAAAYAKLGIARRTELAAILLVAPIGPRAAVGWSEPGRATSGTARLPE